MDDFVDILSILLDTIFGIYLDTYRAIDITYRLQILTRNQDYFLMFSHLTYSITQIYTDIHS